MPDLLPSGSMGDTNLSVPVSSSLPSGMGAREVSASPKIQDGLDPIIYSLDVITSQLDNIISLSPESSGHTLSDLTVDEFDKILQKYFSKEVLSGSISGALINQSPPAKESSLLVRHNVKSSEVSNKELMKMQSSASSSSSSSTGSKGTNLEAGFRKALDVANTATHDPMKLVDDIAGLPFKLIDKFTKGGGKGKSEESFFGSEGLQAPSASGEVAGGDFFGGFGDSGGGFESIFGGGSGGDGVSEEFVLGGIQADSALVEVFDNPNQSKFGTFIRETLEDTVGGGGGGSGGGNGKGGGAGMGGLAIVAVVGLICITLIIFKDLIERIFDRVLIPLGEIVIDVLRAIKDPLIMVITVICEVVAVVLNIIKDILVAIAPYLIVIAEIIANIVVIVLQIVADILVEIKPYLIRMAETISGIIAVVLEIIAGILSALAPYIIRIVDAVGGVIATIVEVIATIVNLVALPIKLISSILEVIAGMIISIVEIVAGFIISWFERNEETISSILDGIAAIAEIVIGIIAKVLVAIEPYIIEIAKVLSGIILVCLEGILAFIQVISFPVRMLAKFLETIEPAIIFVAEFARDFIGNFLVDLLEDIAEKIDVIVDLVSGIIIRVLRSIDKFLEGLEPHMESIGDALGETLPRVLRGISNVLSWIPSRDVNDAIITSSGEIITTHPNDAIIAVQNGSVSMSSASPVSSVSYNAPLESSTISSNPSSNSSSSTTNVYSSSNNIDMNSLSPLSDFSPVGV